MTSETSVLPGTEIVTGKAFYVDDFTDSQMVFAAFKRSPYAHARILDIPKPQSSLIIESILGREAATLSKPHPRPDLPGYKSYDLYALATDKVRFAGEAVAVIAVRERDQIEDALDEVNPEYEVLPPVMDPEAAMSTESALVNAEWRSNVFYKHHFRHGKVAETLRRADLVIKKTFKLARVTGAPLENRGFVASYDKVLKTLTINAPVQRPHVLRTALARTLSFPENKIRVITPNVGGSFGIKGHLFPEYTAVSLLSLKLGVPVKWSEERIEHLQSSVHARSQLHYVEAGFKRDGRILAIRARTIVDVGAYPALPYYATSASYSDEWLTGPYKVDNYEYTHTCVVTNKCPWGHYRGPGAMEANFVMEKLLDIAARRLSIDPADIRRRNLPRPSEFPFKTITGIKIDKGSYRKSLDQVLKLVQYERLRSEQLKLRKRERYIGLGIGIVAEVTGLGSIHVGKYSYPGFEYTSVQVDPTGTVTVTTGLCPQGQVSDRSMAMIVASELGVSEDDVSVIYGDTATMPYGGGTGGGSRSAVIGGGAATVAARRLKIKILRIASHIMKIPFSCLILKNGHVETKSKPKRKIRLEEIARVATFESHTLPAGLTPGLFEIASYAPKVPQTTSNASHIAVVEVDSETGLIKILKYAVVEDCGNIVNLSAVEGQICGGIAQGIGEAFLEKLVYNEDGQLLSSSFMDYLMPTSMDVPNVEIRHLTTPSSVLGGFKGVGEGSLIVSPAVLANAVEDAISPFGCELTELPITPETILKGIQESRT